MTNAVLIPEYELNRDYKKKVFINENSKRLNLQYFGKSDTKSHSAFIIAARNKSYASLSVSRA